MAHRSLVLALLGAVIALSGCLPASDSEGEVSPPSSETLDEMRDFSERYYPIYWLGDSYRGLELSSAEFSDQDALLNYGPSSCSPGSGCTAPPLTISTFGGKQEPFLPPAKQSQVCLGHIRGGVLIQDCRNRRHPAVQSADLYTGGQFRGVYLSINHYIRGLTVEELARAVVPIEDESGVPRRLPPPRPIPCESLEYLVHWWVEMVHEEFGTLPSSCPHQ